MASISASISARLGSRMQSVLGVVECIVRRHFQEVVEQAVHAPVVQQAPVLPRHTDATDGLKAIALQKEMPQAARKEILL